MIGARQVTRKERKRTEDRLHRVPVSFLFFVVFCFCFFLKNKCAPTGSSGKNGHVRNEIARRTLALLNKRWGKRVAYTGPYETILFVVFLGVWKLAVTRNACVPVHLLIFIYFYLFLNELVLHTRAAFPVACQRGAANSFCFNLLNFTLTIFY